MVRVLLVEDDEDLADAVLTGLRREHLAVDHARDIAEAEDRLVGTDYDVMCLDLGLPDGDGIDLCRRLHDGVLTPPRRVLMLTARDDVTDRVAGLDAGADDYLVKPFRLAELAARIRALTRRGDIRATRLEVSDLVLDPVTHEVRRGEFLLDLTSREYCVLHHLCAHADEIVSTESLLEHCWDENANWYSNSVQVIISRLRRKIGDPPLLATVRGSGYRLGVGRHDRRTR